MSSKTDKIITPHVDQETVLKMVSGELDPMEKVVMELHIKGCKSCRKIYEESKKRIQVLNNWSIDTLKNLKKADKRIVISGIGLSGVECARCVSYMDRRTCFVLEGEILFGNALENTEYLLLLVDASYGAVSGDYIERIAIAKSNGTKVLTLVFSSRTGLMCTEELKRFIIAVGEVSEKLLVPVGFPSIRRSPEEICRLGLDVLSQLGSKAMLFVSDNEFCMLSDNFLYAMIERVEHVLNPLTLVKKIKNILKKLPGSNSRKSVAIIFRTSKLDSNRGLNFATIEKQIKKALAGYSIAIRIDPELGDDIISATLIIGLSKVDDIIIAERVAKTSRFSRKPAYWATGLGLSALAALAFFLVMENRNIENYRIQLFNRLDNLRAIIYKNYDISSSRLDTYNETMYYSGKYLQNLSNSLNLWEIRLINYEMQLSFADSIKKLSTIDKMLENIEWQFWEEILRISQEESPRNMFN